MLVSHYLAFLFYFIYHTEIDNFNIIDPSFIKNDHLNNYIRSLYWSVATMLTVGYGDITPYTVR